LGKRWVRPEVSQRRSLFASGQSLDDSCGQLRPFFIEDERSGDNGVLLSADRTGEIQDAMQFDVKHGVWPLQAKTAMAVRANGDPTGQRLLLVPMPLRTARLRRAALELSSGAKAHVIVHTYVGAEAPTS